MENTKLFALTIFILIAIIPLASAIYVGQATSEPTTITFTTTINNDDNTNKIENNRYSQLEAQRQADERIEAELREVTYTEWICINNKLQREITTLGHTETEYGQFCNIPENNQEPNVQNLFIVLSIMLTVFIVLSLLLIIAIVMIKD